MTSTRGAPGNGNGDTGEPLDPRAAYRRLPAPSHPTGTSDAPVTAVPDEPPGGLGPFIEQAVRAGG